MTYPNILQAAEFTHQAASRALEILAMDERALKLTIWQATEQWCAETGRSLPEDLAPSERELVVRDMLHARGSADADDAPLTCDYLRVAAVRGLLEVIVGG